MASPKTNYILEILDMTGSCSPGEEQYCRFESDSPLPVPSVGDFIQLPGKLWKAEERTFNIFGDGPITIHAMIKCKPCP